MNPTTFLDLMRAPEPTPNVMPPAECGSVNAAAAWQDAISGRAPQIGLSDTRAAAHSWLSQGFMSDVERDAKAAIAAPQKAQA